MRQGLVVSTWKSCFFFQSGYICSLLSINWRGYPSETIYVLLNSVYECQDLLWWSLRDPKFDIGIFAYDKLMFTNPIKCVRASVRISIKCHIAILLGISYHCITTKLLNCHSVKCRRQPQYLRSRHLVMGIL